MISNLVSEKYTELEVRRRDFWSSSAITMLKQAVYLCWAIKWELVLPALPVSG